MDLSRGDSFFGQKHGRRSFQHLVAILDTNSPVVRDQQMSTTFRSNTAVKVRKSLQLLDESVGSPLAMVTPRGSLRHSAYTPRQLASGTKFDVSGRMRPTPRKTPQGNRSFQRSLPEESFKVPSYAVSENLFEEDDVTFDVTSNVGLLLAEDPGILASKGMYEDFLKCLRMHQSEADLFTLVNEYEKTCQEQVHFLRTMVHRVSKQEEKFRKTFQVLRLLYEEEITWKLVKNLFKDRQETKQKELMMEYGNDEESVRIQGIYQSDLKIANALLEREQSVREAQLVVDWLESCAQDDCENFAENVKFFSEKAVGYENALYRLKNQQKGLPVGVERPLITELDPDAAVRQNKLPDDLDKEDEDRLLQYIFLLLRAGQLAKAQEVCMECGQSWRAATLEGWKLFHDPNFEVLGAEGKLLPIEGNRNRDIWKKVCWSVAQDPRVGAYERAIISALSGNLRGILPVCISWLDYMWAYFRVMVDVKVEDEIRLKTTIGESLETMPGEYWEQNFSARTIFREIEANETIKKESNSLFYVIQKYIILNDVSGLVEVMYDKVREHKHDMSLHLLRFMAHFVLFLRTADQHTKEDLCYSILECYIEELIKEKHNDLVAYYVSRLPQAAQVHWYAFFLEGITNKEEREYYLDLAEKAGLDLAQITKRVVENIRKKSSVDFTHIHGGPLESVDMQISEEDRNKIEAIDWLVFEVSQRAEAMRQANAVMRTFIAVKKLLAAKEVFNKLPPDSVDIVHKTWYQETKSSVLPQEDRNAIREYLCIKAYLDAMESFNNWFTYYHHGQPAKPDPPQGGSFTDKVAYEHKLKQYELELERWHYNLIMQTQTTKEHIYNVLLFADGGWMVDQSLESDKRIGDGKDVDSIRLEQMDMLRHLILPGLVFLLHNVLHTSEQFQECIQIVDIIASEQRKLYQVFRQDDLQHLVHLLRESSLKLLDQGRGPLGYEI